LRSLVTGATGFLGRLLLSRLEDPVILTRDVERAFRTIGRVQAFEWNPEEGPPPVRAFAGVKAVFNLAGEPIDGRWTAEKKARIRDSRIAVTRNLVSAMGEMVEPPEVMISVSAVGYYGSRGDEELVESCGPGDDFLAGLCSDWEGAARIASEFSVRVVTPRIGIVLGRGGGVVKKVLPIFKLGVGGRLGSGRQYWPWIHVEDVLGIMLFAVKSPHLTGAVNAVSPQPVTNRVFAKELGRVLKRPALLPVPAPVLRLVLGELSSMLLASQRALPQAALDSGYMFRYSNLTEALCSVIG